MSIPQKADKWIVFVLTFGFAAVNCRRQTLGQMPTTLRNTRVK
jgi:hypothetical protein